MQAAHRISAAEGIHLGGGGLHLGGGGLHLGGGGLHLGGLHLGGLRLGGMHLGGLHLGHAMHVGGLSHGISRAHIGATHLARTGAGRLAHTRLAHEQALRGTAEALHAGRSPAEALGVRGEQAAAGLRPQSGLTGPRGATRTARPTGGALPFGSRAFAHNGWQSWHNGRFAHPWQNWGAYPVFFGWAGPLFWPYAYDDIFDDLLWGYGYDVPFWDYGYGDLLGGLFSPYTYGDLAGYLPGGGEAAATRYGRLASRGRPVPAPAAGAPLAGELHQMCGEDTRDIADWPIQGIQQLVEPNAAQRATLDDLANASLKAAQVIRAACPATVAFTPTGRLETMQSRLQAMIEAANIVREPLDRFYDLLSDEQKARLNAAGQSAQQVGSASGSFAQKCRAAGAALNWPQEAIEKAVRPDAMQQENSMRCAPRPPRPQATLRGHVRPHCL